ncbi:MAG: ImmA/IrrE family metallo-endopeptidase [Firmicutes bacterium]|nr:ImmA/IrrE family metallo-endopeptidase [Bacillota bacterium]
MDGGSFSSPDLKNCMKKFLKQYLYENRYSPSPGELLAEVKKRFGPKAQWDFKMTIIELSKEKGHTNLFREYLCSIIEDGSIDEALLGENETDRYVISTVDELVRQSKQYHYSPAFQEMVEFMGKFRDYAPYNNMLVRIQNPSCGFFATANDWKLKFNRRLKEDARPMLILAPMHPVMLVYDLDQTEGDDPPEELLKFSHFLGDWRSVYLKRILENTNQYKIRVNFKPLSSTHSGFATIVQDNVWKKRIVVHDGLDEPSKFGALCHELAHIFLGHLGSDRDRWWPSRYNLEKSVMEIEAEAVAYIVTSQLGLKGTSETYVSRYLKDDSIIPAGLSLDYIAKVSGKIGRMAHEILPKPRPKAKHNRN